MNINNILSKGEVLLVQVQQAPWRPGGKEVTPSQVFITSNRIIIETSTMFGLKKDYQSFSYADVIEVELKKNVFSSSLIIYSWFKGHLHIESIKHNQAQEIEQIINQKITAYGYGLVEVNNNHHHNNQGRECKSHRKEDSGGSS